MNIDNKWVRAAIPALLIHISVGTVYCWSTFKMEIAERIGASSFAVGWAFSLAIFFLGMSAAFAGRFVELNIHKSSMLACLCFCGGMVGTGLVLWRLTGVYALVGIYLCYGALMGVGLGIGYITPVKTLMLWFEDNKGLATGISIMGFGLAKAIATPIMLWLSSAVGIANMFIILGLVYGVLMWTAHLLLQKPEGWVEDVNASKLNSFYLLEDMEFVAIWLMFFLNIHCGLMLISSEKQLLQTVFNSSPHLPILLAVIPSATAVFNALGRIGYSTLSDKMDERVLVYHAIFNSSILVAVMSVVFYGGNHGVSSVFYGAVLLMLLVVNAGYGGGFSTLPALLSERFGMTKISQIHGMALSAWAIAGITGSNTTELIMAHGGSYREVLFVGAVLYLVALIVCVTLVGYKDSRKGIALG